MEKHHIELRENDRRYLRDVVLANDLLKERIRKRARGLLELDKGKTYHEVAMLLQVSYPTVHGWGKKYRTNGLDFLDDKQRPGRPAHFTEDQKTSIRNLAADNPPPGHTRWSLRLLAEKAVELGFVEAISHMEIRRILKK